MPQIYKAHQNFCVDAMWFNQNSTLHKSLQWLETNVRLPLKDTYFDIYVALPLKNTYKKYTYRDKED